jgi:hypothetical protein
MGRKLHVCYERVAYGPVFNACVQCMADLNILGGNVQTAPFHQTDSWPLCMNILMTDLLSPYGHTSPSYEGPCVLKGR